MVLWKDAGERRVSASKLKLSFVAAQTSSQQDADL